MPRETKESIINQIDLIVDGAAASPSRIAYAKSVYNLLELQMQLQVVTEMREEFNQAKTGPAHHALWQRVHVETRKRVEAASVAMKIKYRLRDEKSKRMFEKMEAAKWR